MTSKKDVLLLYPASGKVRLEFDYDKIPKLIFVSQYGSGIGDKLYIDGKIVEGVKRVRIESGVDELTTHCIDFLTAVSGEGGDK